MAENRIFKANAQRDATQTKGESTVELHDSDVQRLSTRRFESRLFDESWSRNWNNTCLTLMVRSPHSLFAYWEVQTDWQKLIAAHFQSNWYALPLSLRLHDVTDVIFDGHNSHELRLAAPSRSVDNWYFHDVQPDRNYLVDLGTWTEEGQFFSILRSNPVRTPRDACSSQGEIRYGRVGVRATPRVESLPHSTSPHLVSLPSNHLKNFGIPAYANEFDGYGALTPDVRRDEEGEGC